MLLRTFNARTNPGPKVLHSKGALAYIATRITRTALCIQPQVLQLERPWTSVVQIGQYRSFVSSDRRPLDQAIRQSLRAGAARGISAAFRPAGLGLVACKIRGWASHS